MCCWDPPCKRGRKGKDKTVATEDKVETKLIPQQPTLISNDEVLAVLSQHQTTIQRAFEIMQLFPRNILENMLLHVRALHGELNVSQSFANNEVAFILSKLAYVLTTHGQARVGQYLHNKAVTQLGTVHEVFDYTTACAIQYLAAYNFSDNEVDAARQRVLQVWNYIQRASQLIPLTDVTQNSLELIRHRFLRHRCLSIAALLANRVDEALSIKFALRQWYLEMKFNQAQGRNTPFFGDQYEYFMSRIDSDIVNATNNEALGLNTISQFVDYFRQYEKEDLYKTLLMSVNAYKIHLLHGMGRTIDPEVKLAADTVVANMSAMCLLSEPPLWTQPVARATQVHLHFYEAAKSQMESSEACSKLAEELHMFNRLAQCHKIVGERYSAIITRLNELVTAPVETKAETVYNFNQTLLNFKNAVGSQEGLRHTPINHQPIMSQPQPTIHHQPIHVPQPLHPQAIPQQYIVQQMPPNQAQYYVVPQYTTTVQYVQVPVRAQQVDQYAYRSSQFVKGPDDLENFIDDFFGENPKNDNYDEFDFL